MAWWGIPDRLGCPGTEEQVIDPSHGMSSKPGQGGQCRRLLARQGSAVPRWWDWAMCRMVRVLGSSGIGLERSAMSRPAPHPPLPL